MEQAKFIVIDGMDGSGKGTQIKLLQEKLKAYPVAFTREPGGTLKAEEIRQMLLRQDGPESTPECDFFLFWAARASHVSGLIKPALEQGRHVISDRYDSSTYAFQIWGEDNENLKTLFFEMKKSFESLMHCTPHRYIILDVPAQVAYERRAKDATQEKSRFDVKPLKYHEGVRVGFRAFAKMTSNVHIVDANRSIESVHADIWQIVSAQLGL